MRNPLMAMVAFTMFFGGGMIPTYLVINQMNVLNTIWAVVLPGAITAQHVIIVRTFFQSIPSEMVEAAAIDGENKAKAEIARSQAVLREKEAEALKLAVAAEKVQAAKALEESYSAEQSAEVARAAREKATKEADIIVAADIEKRKLEIEAEAIAEQTRRKAKGEADAIFCKMDAEARGVREKLTKQAEGMDALVKSAGTAPDAVRLLIADKLETIVAEQVKAISGVKIDKVTVWDGGQGTDGKTSTANFLSGLLKSLPPLEEIYNMAGLSLPKIVSPVKEEEKAKKDAAEAKPAEQAAPAKPDVKDKK